MIHNNLGNAYWSRIEGNRADNLEQAIAHYSLALEVRTRDAFPADWAMTHNNLATAYWNRIEGSRAANLEQAITHYSLAFEVYTRDAFPVKCRLSQRNLGHLYFGERGWSEALVAYTAAIEIGNDLLAASPSETGRQSEIAETAAVFVNSAYCLLHTGRYGEALAQMEAGKTRLLAEALALSDTNLDRLDTAQREELATLRQTIRAAEAEFRLPPETRRPNVVLMDILQQARTDLAHLIATIRAEHPDFMPSGLDLPGILALAPPGGALVAPLFTSQGSVIFVLPHGAETVTAEHVIRLDGFTSDGLDALLRGTEENPGWLRAYLLRSSYSEWLAALDRLTGRLWDTLLALVHKRLQALGADRIIFMPQGGLSLLPLHAAWRMENGQKRYLLDDYVVSYTPSAYALDAGHRRLTARDGQRSALVSGVSTYHGKDDLPNVRIEVESIAALLAVAPLVDAQVTPQVVLERASETTYLHLSCHGEFAWGNTLASALVLAGDERLTLTDILSKLDLTSARLVTLSACETGITDVQRSPDEYVGLPAGFMQAGAPGVASSLWSVSDLSTTLLMERFYFHLIQDALPPAEALRHAQRWLRDVPQQEVLDHLNTLEHTWRERRDESPAAWKQWQAIRQQMALVHHLGDPPFARPFYWAAFQAVGAVL